MTRTDLLAAGSLERSNLNVEALIGGRNPGVPVDRHINPPCLIGSRHGDIIVSKIPKVTPVETDLLVWNKGIPRHVESCRPRSADPSSGRRGVVGPSHVGGPTLYWAFQTTPPGRV
jgi:hypothetical protein